MTGSLPRRVEEAFAASGPLAGAIPRFEPRPGQKALAAAWAGALERGEILVAEAATGIGKTLAYLVPCVLSGLKSVVSTGTRTLQHQLAENDLPLLRRALGVPFSFAVAKGRGNYLCRRRWRRFAAEPLFEFAPETRHFEAIRAFAETTRTGDLAGCPGVPEDLRAWGEINARAETCDASGCPDRERCFLAEARRRAAEADVVVANHHLFFADLALRMRRGAGRDEGGRGFGEVLPPAEAVVLDEAQGIEETASAFFGVSVSLGRALELARDARRAFGAAPGAGGQAAADAFRRAAEGAFLAVPGSEGRFSLPPRGRDAVFDARMDALREAGETLSLLLAAAPPAPAGAESEGEALVRRARSFLEDVEAVAAADPAEAVAWGERRGAAAAFHRTPVEVAPLLGGTIWREGVPTLLTSATLSVSRDLAYFRERVGLGGLYASELIVDNEFDFAGRAMVYVPRDLPDPGSEAFAAAAARETEAVIALSGGGALVLCTSYRTLGAVREALGDALPFTVLVQGEAPRMELLRAFREEGDAVLIGTGTFWEGIDVPGESLRCVVIDKLPFAPPGDPVVTARIRAVRARGGDPFAEYQLPEAVLALRQGVGRLLRRGDDYGVIALLDRRVVDRPYGAAFRASLPAMPWTRDREDAAVFYRRFRPVEGDGKEEGDR